MAIYIGAHFLLVFFVRYYLTCKIPPYKNYLTFWEWKETIAARTILPRHWLRTQDLSRLKQYVLLQHLFFTFDIKCQFPEINSLEVCIALGNHGQWKYHHFYYYHVFFQAPKPTLPTVNTATISKPHESETFRVRYNLWNYVKWIWYSVLNILYSVSAKSSW